MKKKVPKLSNHTPEKLLSDGLFLFLSKKHKSSDIKHTGKDNLLKILDELSTLKYSAFHIAQTKMVKSTFVKLQQLKQQGRQSKHVRCENSGKNKSLE